MTGKLQSILVLSDGRPGHENQSIGLANALAARTDAGIQVLRWPAGEGLLKRLSLARRPGAADLIIGAGHGTHLPLLVTSRRLRARSVVIMKPSLPCGWFDLCLIPRHDLRDPQNTPRVVATRGALNRLPETPVAKTDSGLIMIGGESKHHAWDGAPLPAMMQTIVRARPELAWTIGDSRRTPAGFADGLSALVSGATIVPHQQTQPGWLTAVMGAAREVWVTEDSVSMIFEALTAGARVGILPMPVKNPAARTVKAVADLVADGYARTYAGWREAPDAWGNTPRFHETGRCADIILQRFFK